MLQLDGPGFPDEWNPWKRHRVENRNPHPGVKGLDEWCCAGDTVGACCNHLLKAPSAVSKQRGRGPEPQAKPPQIGAATRVPSAGREVVIAMEDGGAVALEKAAGGKRVEDTRQQRWRPAIEKIAGDGEMIG